MLAVLIIASVKRKGSYMSLSPFIGFPAYYE